MLSEKDLDYFVETDSLSLLLYIIILLVIIVVISRVA